MNDTAVLRTADVVCDSQIYPALVRMGRQAHHVACSWPQPQTTDGQQHGGSARRDDGRMVAVDLPRAGRRLGLNVRPTLNAGYGA